MMGMHNGQQSFQVVRENLDPLSAPRYRLVGDPPDSDRSYTESP